jgi:toxin ParE1/3/4
MGRNRSDIVPGIRYFPVGNYLIFYRETGQGVEIIRVLHGARSLGFIDFDFDM